MHLLGHDYVPRTLQKRKLADSARIKSGVVLQNSASASKYPIKENTMNDYQSRLKYIDAKFQFMKS